MSLRRKVAQRAQRRVLRVRSAMRASALPRVSVFRSLKHIYAQVIDDKAQRTLVSCSSCELGKIEGDKKAVAYAVGLELAKRALQSNITVTMFDRGRFLYHGRVKALAEGLRTGGVQV